MKKQNIRIAKQLVKLAKSLIGLDITIDNNGDTGNYSMKNYDPKQVHDQYEQDRLDEAQKQGKKYILHHKEYSLWRIQACKDFGGIKKGDFGGLIESEDNLSHDGDCWVEDNAYVYDKAQVSGNADVYDKAQVRGNAKVYGNAHVGGNAKVYGNAHVYGNAFVYGYAQVDYEVKDKEITE